MKNLVFDVNVVLDLWLCRKPAEKLYKITNLLENTHGNGIKNWMAVSSLHTLEYMAKALIKKEGVDGENAKKIVNGLLGNLFENISQLSCYGYHVNKELLSESDIEDVQIVKAANELAGEVAIVTNDKRFKTLGYKVHQITLDEVDVWLNDKSNQKIDFIDLKTQQDVLRPQLEENIHRVLHHGQYIMGPEVRQLEEKLQLYTGSKHCITVASGTEALLISLMAIGIKPGDEVITTPFTFAATAEMIVLLGAIPVFVDIEADTCNINASLIDAAITTKTKAIMPVSLYGQPADMDEINAIATKHGNIPVIEDACQSFGATYKGKKSCNLSTIGCSSFFPSKPLGCYGDGGAIFTNDDALAQTMREIRVHGQSKRYYHTRVGVGGRMDTLQCAIVLAKLERFEWEVEQRIAIGQQYNQLMDEAGIKRVQQRNDRTSVFAQYTVLVDDREQLEKKLKDAKIPTAVHYPVPLNQQPAYQHLCCPDCTPVAKEIAKQVMSLPMSPDLAESKLICKMLIS